MALSRRETGDLLRRHGLRPSRALGQNFLVDPNIVGRIVRLAGVGREDHVVEVGAGVGSLTVGLAETGAAITAIEIDRYLLPALEEVVGDRPNVRVVAGDALALDWRQLLDPAPSWVLVGNLPYNVATPLVLSLLDDAPPIGRMLVMVQREVAERLVARPGSRTYGIPSVRVAYWATSELVGRVPPDVFVPRPRVESALVRIKRRPQPAVDADPDRLFMLVRAGFGQRRKMLRRALGDRVSPESFAAAGVAPEARAEQLDIEAWGRLADAASPPSPPRMLGG